MNEWDVIEKLDHLPDKIILNGGGMRSKVWECSQCRHVHNFEEEVRPPAPCTECQSIAFKKINR